MLPWGELCPNEGYLWVCPASLSCLVRSTAVSLLLDFSFFFFYPFLKGLASQGIIFQEMSIGGT